MLLISRLPVASFVSCQLTIFGHLDQIFFLNILLRISQSPLQKLTLIKLLISVTLAFPFLLQTAVFYFVRKHSGADAIKKFAPSLGIPYLTV